MGMHRKYRDSMNLLSVIRFALEDDRSYLYNYLLSNIKTNDPLSNIENSILKFFMKIHEKHDVVERGLNEHLRKLYETNNISCTVKFIHEVTINYVIEVKFDDNKELNCYKLKSPERYEALIDERCHDERIF